LKHSRLVLACLLAVLVAASAVVPAGASGVTVVADGTWYWQNPKPFGDELDAVSVVDANRIWAIGVNGILVRTTDGGMTWQSLDLPVDSFLTDVEFTDANNGCVVGAIPPVIMRTSNGGATWNVQWRGTGTDQILWWFSAPGRSAVAKARTMLAASAAKAKPGADMRAEIGRVARAVVGRPGSARAELPYTIFFRDALHGWVGGEMGLLMQTNDGGRTWIRRDTKTALGLYSIQFPTALVGYISTDSDAVLKTLDGGRTWTRQTTGQTGWVNDIAFVDASHGWAIGSGQVLETTDGATWVPVFSGGNTYFSAIAAADANHVWAVGERWDGSSWAAFINYSPDGGDNWAEAPSAGAAQLNDIAMRPGAAAIVGDGATFLHSTDPTAGWTLRGTSATRDDLRDVSMVDTRVGWAAGGRAALRTLDGGATWTTTSATGVNDYQCVASIDASNAYVASLDVIERTSDGGASWDSMSAPTYTQDLEFRDRDHGWALGYYGDLLIITNNGMSTETTTLPWGDGMRAMSFPTTMTGYAVGYYGRIAKTVDGGHSWAQIPVTETVGLHSVDFVDADNGWIGGDNGLILHTTDGGATWERQGAEAWSLWSIDFTDLQNGYALAQGLGWWGSSLVYTHNGGRDWMVARSVLPQQMNALDFVTPRQGWAVGYDGAIMATRRQGTILSRPAASPLTANYGATTRLSARLTANTRDVERRGDVRVWRKAVGSSAWVSDGSVAYDIATNRYVTRRAVTRNTYFQFRFAGDALYQGSNSPATLVKSRAWLSRPVTPAVVTNNVLFNISGLIKPAHGGTTALDFYRRQSGRWVLRRTLFAPNGSAPGDMSRYARKVEVLLPGDWYVQARHSDAGHALSLSPRRYFKAL
jgi:photosystem II stability/assembly factor-like uncharacterized protein